MSNISKKYVSISFLEQQASQNAPIWALNGAASSEVAQPGEIHVGIPKINGGSKIDDLYLPQTWLPVCLTDQIPRVQLLAASEFRNAVNNSLIRLISESFAEELLAQDGVAEERARLAQLRQAVRDATGSRSIQSSGAEIISTNDIGNKDAERTDPTELNSAFMLFVNATALKNDIETLNLIRSRGKFSSRELTHMIKAFTDKPKTVGFLRTKKAERKAAKAAKASS